MHATDRYSSAVARAAAVLVGTLLAGAACLAQAPAPAQKLLVNDILVRGNQRVNAQDVISKLKTHINGEFRPDVVQEDVRTLLATRQFGNVEARYKVLPGTNKVDVYFIVADYPNVVREVIYKGCHSIKKAELETLTGVKKDAPVNPVNNQLACQAIVGKLREKGRLFASCTLEEGTKIGDTRVVFNITEGPEVYVRDIDFVGNHFVSGPVLRTHINSSRRFLGLNLLSRPYIPQMADHDVDMLREYYRGHGFLDVKIGRTVNWDPDSKTVVLVFHIDEGKRYRIHGTPQVVSNARRDPAELPRAVQVKAEEFYDQAKVDKDKKYLEAYIGAGGVKARVDERVVFDGPAQCSLTYDVMEQGPAYVGQIFVIGNTTTRQNVILRQVPLFPGQLLSYPAKAEGERNLARLGIFETNPETGVHPTIDILDEAGDSRFKDVVINVQETRTGSLMFGVGYNSNAGPTGSIVLNERNFDITRFPRSVDDLLSGQAFRGAGQELRLEAVPGTQLQRYTATFREPYLFDSPFSLTESAYFYQRIFNEYEEQRVGDRLTIGRRLNQYWTASITGRVEDIEGRNISIFAPPDYQEIEGHNFLVSGRLAFTRDSRDSYLRPTEGSVLDISFEQATGDFTFPLFNVDFNQYWTIFQRADGTGRHVLTLHSQLGIAGANTPVFERYFAGGFRSIRGFAFRGVGPTDPFGNFKLGGDFQFLNSLEYQIPVAASDNFYFVTFVDSGTVERRVDIKDYRVSAGFGVRFTVPLLGPVPIALDFGFPIVKGPHDTEQVFSFWIGVFR